MSAALSGYNPCRVAGQGTLTSGVAVPGRSPGLPALVAAVGSAGAGKTTWTRAHYLPREIVCLDELRLAVADDESDQTATEAAVKVMNTVVAARMTRQLTTVVDATNATPRARRTLLGLAAAAHMPAVAVVFDVALGVCLARNGRRPLTSGGHRGVRKRVPPAVVCAQHALVSASRMVLAREGWAEIRHVDAAGVLR